jgi:hypothetical protein
VTDAVGGPLELVERLAGLGKRPDAMCNPGGDAADDRPDDSGLEGVAKAAAIEQGPGEP